MQKTPHLRLCAPLVLIALASGQSQKFSTSKLLTSVSNRGLEPGVDIAFEKRDSDSVEITLLNAAAVKNLHGLMTGNFDQPSENPRFFQPNDDGRFTATVTYDLLQEIGTPKSIPSQDKWRHIVNELVTEAPVSMMATPATKTAATAQEARQRV